MVGQIGSAEIVEESSVPAWRMSDLDVTGPDGKRGIEEALAGGADLSDGEPILVP
jgi:hypothetical protein